VHLEHLAFPECVFIHHLLDFCDGPDIFDLFETITGYNTPRSPPSLGPWLRSFGFCQYLFRAVSSINFLHRSAHSSPYRDPVFNKAACLYELISRCCEHPSLQTGCRVAAVVQCLTQQFDPIPDFVQTTRWKAIVAVSCQATASVCVVFYTQAIAFLEAEVDHLREYRVLALTFLCRMMKIDDQIYEIMLKMGLIPSLMTLVLHFPNSSLLHDQFLKFVANGLYNFEFAGMMLMVYVPVMLQQWEKNPNRLMRSLAMDVMRLISDAVDADERLRAAVRTNLLEVALFRRGPLKSFLQTISRPYGGYINRAHVFPTHEAFMPR
jgi:hypothetical protein